MNIKEFDTILDKDINECQSFDEVSKFRKMQASVNERSHDDYKNILTRIYREPTHFIYELLQNADNVRATKAKFILEKDRLIFMHDGKDEFTLNNVISITGVGNSFYQTEEKAGGFGVGFKAVFAICERPEIYSRDYNFAIENLSIPVEIQKQTIEDGYTTMFIIPFSSKKYKTPEIHSRVLKELQNLDISTLMFLFRLKSASIKASEWDREISLVGKKAEDATLYTDKETGVRYLTFYKKLSDSEHCSIAYQLDEDSDVTSPHCQYVSSFFPTKVLSEVNMIVDATFTLATTRETLDYEDPHNQAMLDGLKQLFKSSIETLKKLGFLTPYTISQMPLEENPDNALAQALYEGFKEKMMSGAYIPTTNGRYVTAKKALVPANSDIQKLVKRKNWVDREYGVKYYKYELEILEYDLPELIKELGNAELKEKSDDWLYAFYSYVIDYYNQNNFSNEWLLRAPILKTRTNNFVAAKDKNGLVNLFRKSNGISDAHTVHQLFTTQSENVPEATKHRMLELLTAFGIQERSPKTTIENDILKKWPSADNEARFKLFYQIADIYNRANSNEKVEIIKMLESFDYGLLATKEGNKITWTSDIVYENTDELHDLLNGVPDVYFVHPRLWTERYEEKKNSAGEIKEICLGTNELCCALGVVDQFIIEHFHIYYSYDYNKNFELTPRSLKNLPINEENWRYRTMETYYIDNYDMIIANVDTLEKGKALIRLVSCIPQEEQFGVLGRAKLHGSVLEMDQTIPSDPFIKLNEAKWCFDENGKKVFPCQLTKEEFIDVYRLSGNEAILKHLEFKNDIRSSLKQEDRERLEFFDSCSEEELALMEEVKNKILLERQQKEQSITIQPYDDKDLDVIFATEQDFLETNDTLTDTITGGRVTNPSKESASKTLTIKTKVSGLNKIEGDQNEIIAMSAIVKKYDATQIADGCYISESGEKMSLMGGNHKGYDIKIEKDGVILRRIEVKPYHRGAVSITPLEWEYAKKYKAEYDIYRVKKITGQPSEIYVLDNPYQRYIDGKIEIVPSALKILD